MEDAPIGKINKGRVNSTFETEKPVKPKERSARPISDSITKSLSETVKNLKPKENPVMPPPELVSVQDKMNPQALRKQILRRIEQQYSNEQLLDLVEEKREENKLEMIKTLVEAVSKRALAGSEMNLNNLITSEMSKIATQNGQHDLATKLQFTALLKNNPSVRILFALLRSELGDSSLAMKASLEAIDDYFTTAGQVRRSYHRNPLIREAVINALRGQGSEMASSIVQSNYVKSKFLDWTAELQNIEPRQRSTSVQMAVYIDYIETAYEVLNDEFFIGSDLKLMMKRLKGIMQQLAHFATLEEMIDTKNENNLISLLDQNQGKALIRAARELRWLKPLIPSIETIGNLSGGLSQLILAEKAVSTAQSDNKLYNRLMSLAKAFGDSETVSAIALSFGALSVAQSATMDAQASAESNAISLLMNDATLFNSEFIEGITKGLGKLAGFDVVQSRSLSSAVQLYAIISSSLAAISQLIQEAKKAGIKPNEMVQHIRNAIEKKSKLIQHLIDQINEETHFLENDLVLKMLIDEIEKEEPNLFSLIQKTAKRWMLEGEVVFIPNFREAA